MIPVKEQYVIDENGRRTAVLVDVKRYDELLQAWEEIESIRRFDEAKNSDDEKISFIQAIDEIERSQK